MCFNQRQQTFIYYLFIILYFDREDLTETRSLLQESPAHKVKRQQTKCIYT